MTKSSLLRLARAWRARLGNLTIGTKLAFFFLATSIVPIAMVAYLSISESEKELLAERIGRLQHLNDLKQERIDSLFKRVRRDLFVIQHDDTILRSLSVLDRGLTHRNSASYRKAKDRVDSRLKPLQRIKHFDDILLVNAKGQIVYSADDAHEMHLIGAKIPTGPLSRFDLTSRDIQIAPVFINDSRGGSRGTFVSAPLLGDRGDLRGFVVFDVDLDAVYDFIVGKSGLGKTGETLLFEILRDDRAVLLTPLRHGNDVPILKEISLSDPRAASLRAAVKRGISWGIETDYRGEKVMASWRYLPALRWVLVSKIDYKESMALSESLRRNGVVIGLSVTVLALLFAYLLGRGISRPLSALADYAREIGRGNLSARPDSQALSPTAETRGLARSLLQMAEELRGLYRGLEQKVSDRTTELQSANSRLETEVAERRRVEAELLNAKELATQATRAKSLFLASMSHEIRTPIAAIIGYTEVLFEKEARRTDQLKFLDAIRRNGQHLLDVINDILDLSKVEAGHLTITRESFSLVEELREIETYTEIAAKEKGLRFTIMFDGPVPELVSSDSVRLRQILLNLVSNAIKFTKTGWIRLEVGMVSSSRPGARPSLQFIVSDTGSGMPVDQQDQLFRPFTQLPGSSDERKKGGTGLGLALARQLARLLGGDVRLVRSAPTEGSAFSLTIDPGDLDGVRFLTSFTSQFVRAVSPPPRDGSPLSGCSVLLVEDGPDNQFLLRHFLEQAGARVDVAEDGVSAVKKALSDEYNVVLMDIQLPKLDGYGATRTLRSQGYGVPIVALTAHAMKEEIEKSLTSGCNGCLTKPVDSHRLIVEVARFARQGQRASAPA